MVLTHSQMIKKEPFGQGDLALRDLEVGSGGEALDRGGLFYNEDSYEDYQLLHHELEDLYTYPNISKLFFGGVS